jgi:CBS domain containing-hemolysin-like protein
MTVWLGLGLLALLLLLNAFLVSAEFAFVRVRPTRLEELARAGSRRASAALGLVRKLDGTLAATQVGITLANLGIGWLGEPAVARLLEPVAEAVGLVESLHVVSFVAAFLVVTALTVILGELVPRVAGIQMAEPVALMAGGPVRFLRAVLFPLVIFTHQCASAVVRIVGLPPLGTEQGGHTEEELRAILALSHARGHLSRVGRDILEKTLGFSRLTARQIMVPRPDVVWLSASRSPAENREIARASGYTRFPLCEGDLDHVLGIVNIKDFLPSGQNVDLTAVMRPPILVPETATADRLLRLFQRRTLHMAVVVDEYGGTSGIVTLEDVLEEIVGEVRDEFDEEPQAIATAGPGRINILGTARLADVARVLGAADEARQTEVDTIAGYVQDRLGRLAREGDTVRVGAWLLRVDQVRGRRIMQLTAAREPEAGSEGAPGESA